MKITRPSVACWDHKRNAWYITDMYNKESWFGSDAPKADYNALTNFLNYTDYLEKRIEEYERTIHDRK